jgi:succinate-semialdehyde dehydrogenase/glutarate-semialdehyde dehydrogenase
MVNALQVVNPATGRAIASVVKDGQPATDAAIKSAHDAFKLWGQHTPAAQRAQFMRRWYDEIVQHQKDIALIMTSECGKPLAEAQNEIAAGLESVDWFAAEAERCASSAPKS